MVCKSRKVMCPSLWLLLREEELGLHRSHSVSNAVRVFFIFRSSIFFRLQPDAIKRQGLCAQREQASYRLVKWKYTGGKIPHRLPSYSPCCLVIYSFVRLVFSFDRSRKKLWMNSDPCYFGAGGGLAKEWLLVATGRWVWSFWLGRSLTARLSCRCATGTLFGHPPRNNGYRVGRAGRELFRENNWSLSWMSTVNFSNVSLFRLKTIPIFYSVDYTHQAHCCLA